ncbi:MAG: hypothetical protein LIP01_12085, partial [Tannerellaceae bacterium]|nr:hypothetical protein [Tannerellaceae bacterium]
TNFKLNDMKIKSINLQRMRQQQAYGFYGYVVTVLDSVTIPQLLSIKAEFKEAYKNFDFALKPVRKTEGGRYTKR